LKLWKMKPMVSSRSRVSSRSLSAAVSCPATRTVPRVATSTQPMRLRRVVFPLPEGPAMEMNSPRWTSIDTPRSAGTTVVPSWYSFTTSTMLTIGSLTTSPRALAGAIERDVPRQRRRTWPAGRGRSRVADR
jgi:hypothetical protein